MHESRSDPEARLCRKSNAIPALPSYLEHVLSDSCHGLVVNERANQSDGSAEREVAAAMLTDVAQPHRRVTVAADKAFDTRGVVSAYRKIGVTPHAAQHTRRIGGSAIDARTTRHAGYALTQRKRKLIEQCCGGGKTIGPLRKLTVMVLAKVDQPPTLTMAAYNLTRLRRLDGTRMQGA